MSESKPTLHENPEILPEICYSILFLRFPLLLRILIMHPMLNIAVRAARNAGNIITRSIDKVESLHISQKGKNDFVSEIDRIAEQEIIQTIRKAYPGHALLAEESGLHKGDDYTWIIDPLDGTTNFLHGFPQYAVSIAVRHKGEIEQGVVFNPLSQELFTASRGAGAMLNDRRLRVSQQHTLRGALLGTGFPFKAQQHLDSYLQMFTSLFKNTAGIRRAGSAALDLAYVAAGRLDGFWEIGLCEWDIAAGILLIQEAGGVVSDFENEKNYFKSGNIIAGNLKLHELLLNSIQPHVTAELRRFG